MRHDPNCLYSLSNHVVRFVAASEKALTPSEKAELIAFSLACLAHADDFQETKTWTERCENLLETGATITVSVLKLNNYDFKNLAG